MNRHRYLDMVARYYDFLIERAKQRGVDVEDDQVKDNLYAMAEGMVDGFQERRRRKG